MTFTCFGGFLLGGSNVEKWSDHWKKEFFINDYSAEALIPLKEGHQGLLKQHVRLHEGINISGGGGAEGFQFGEKMRLSPKTEPCLKWKKNVLEGFEDLFKSCVFFGVGLEGSDEEIMGR